MTRVKRGTIANKRRKSVLKAVKGFRWGRKSKERLAREALLHAGVHAYKGRKLKKRESRKLWQQRIGAATRQSNLSYSKFINLMTQKKIGLDRKVLSEIADKYPHVFARIVQHVNS
ncbi:MAG: 50S ribosomal protein L20 [Candidatus Sungbacteria bacterium]|nr:50S ribosomal protein L20 [bacterium]MDZ4260569.1 50S ribosomal protein L20 [Candidatus Sungbacteria bacterium]